MHPPNALVAVGAALFASLGELGLAGSDPMRVAAQIVTGIGFLGGGGSWWAPLRYDALRAPTLPSTFPA